MASSPDGVFTMAKFIGFVPAGELAEVRAAVFAAGAGRIGDYSECSWSTVGTGTFRGLAGSDPTIGEPGRFEEVTEVRFETVCPLDRVAQVCQAFVDAHSYEEPAYEVIPLITPPIEGKSAAARVQAALDHPAAPSPAPAQMSMDHTDPDGVPTELWFDGGSRGNPGPAAAGFILRDAEGNTVDRVGVLLGRCTNNVAEYNGLVQGLERAIELGARQLHVYSDSELVVRQMRGEYRVKNADLKPLAERAQQLLRTLDGYQLEHVRRHLNAEADALVNETLDDVGQ